jgi:CobQ-like glutamine amidotransferase family enzyme
MARFKIAHLYPDLMNLYGDRGNLICLQKRLQWRGQQCEIHTVRLGQPIDFNGIDMVFMGGGSDREQGLVYQDLVKRVDAFYEAIWQGLPVLFICGAYQLLGKAYITPDGKEIPGLGIYDFITRVARPRLIGNILLRVEQGGVLTNVVGFENHGGRTYLQDANLQPFGQVVKGHGNNGQDGGEGLKHNNLIGTYLHGPLLPKNPAVADFFITAMAQRRGITISHPLDDSIENFAHQQIQNRIVAR